MFAVGWPKHICPGVNKRFIIQDSALFKNRVERAQFVEEATCVKTTDATEAWNPRWVNNLWKKSMKIHLRTCVNLSSARMRKNERQSRAILSKKGEASWILMSILTQVSGLCHSRKLPCAFQSAVECGQNCLSSATEFEFRGSSCEKAESWDCQGGGGGGGGVSEDLWSAGNNDAVNS